MPWPHLRLRMSIEGQRAWQRPTRSGHRELSGPLTRQISVQLSIQPYVIVRAEVWRPVRLTLSMGSSRITNWSVAGELGLVVRSSTFKVYRSAHGAAGVIQNESHVALQGEAHPGMWSRRGWSHLAPRSQSGAQYVGPGRSHRHHDGW